MVFFTDTNGGNDATPNNRLASHYAPLQQLSIDLLNDTVADYNWITPNQYNDMHTALTGGYKGLTGDAAEIRQGDDFLSQIVPMIMASKAYKNHGMIIIWWDESESDGVAGDNADDFKIGRAHVELQSPCNLVCRLLLEKKKITSHHNTFVSE